MVGRHETALGNDHSIVMWAAGHSRDCIGLGLRVDDASQAFSERDINPGTILEPGEQRSYGRCQFPVYYILPAICM